MNATRFARLATVAIIILLSSFRPATASVAEGRAALARQTPADLQLAHQAFSAAVAADPYKFDLPARFLKVATALALEFGREEFLEEWRRLGITIVDPSIYSFHYELPVDSDGVFQPAEGASTAQSLAYIIGRRTVLDEALAGLKEIDCPDFNLTLTAAETSLLDVRIDLADVCLLRALLHAGQAAIFIAEGINSEADYALFHRLHAESRLNPQQVLAELPALLRHTAKTSERDKARAQLLSAYAEFRRAYDFIRLRREPATGTPNLFEFADAEGAAVFAEQMEAVAESLAGTPVVLPAAPSGDTNLLGGQMLDLARFFSPSAPAFRDLLPRYYDRGFFRRGSWPDLTLGGILPSATSELLDRLALEASVLQATLYYPYTFSLLVSSQLDPSQLDSDGDGLSDAWESGQGRYRIVRGSWNYDTAEQDARTTFQTVGTPAPSPGLTAQTPAEVTIAGHLATITDDQEAAYVRSFIEAQPHDDLVVDMLIGASDAGSEGDWQWATGEKWNYTNWYATEPNNVRRDEHPEGENYLSYIIRWNHKWADVPYGPAWAGGYRPAAYLLEFGYPTDPYNADTDGDGHNDYEETVAGTDPNDPSVYPVSVGPRSLASGEGDQQLNFSAMLATPSAAPPEPLVGEIRGLAVDPQGNLYVADNGFHVIRKISPDGFITVVAGQKWQDWYERDELVRRAHAGQPSYYYSYTDSPSDIFDELRGIACDTSGNVYFVSGRRIMHLAPDGSLRALAGRSGYYSWGPEDAVDGTGSGAVFDYPQALACDAAGNIYVTDETCIRKITPAGVVTTLAGLPDHLPDGEGLVDGPGSMARFSDWMTGIAVDASGNIYVNDTGNKALRKIQPDGTTTTLVASRDLLRHYDAHASQAGLVWPEGLAVDGNGRLFFGDNNTVRSLSPDGQVVTHGGKPHANGFVMGTGEDAVFSGHYRLSLGHFAVDRRGTLYAGNRRGDIVRGVSAVDLPDGDPFPAPTPYPQPDPEAPQGPPWPVPPSAPAPGAGSFGTFEFSESTLVLAGENRVITLTGTYRGDLSYLHVTLRRSSAPWTSVSATYNGSYFSHPTAPRDKDRVLSLKFEIPGYVQDGEWVVEYVSAGWADGSWSSTLPEEFEGLSFLVQNTNPDLTRPTVLSVAAQPVGVNPMYQEQRVAVFVELAADSSGLAYGDISFVNQTGNGWQYATAWLNEQHLFAVETDSLIYRTFVTLPAGTTAADYVVNSLNVQDRAGNRINYTRSYADNGYYAGNPDYAPLPPAIEGIVFSTGTQYPAYDSPDDLTPPAVVDVQFVPPVVDVTSADAEVEVRVFVTDNFSGVNWINLNFELNDGYGYGSGNASSFRLISGNALNGVYSGRLWLPRGSSPGQWRVSHIGVGDRDGNYADYSFWGGNLPDLAASRRLTVVSDGTPSVPLLQDASIELPGGVAVLDTWAGEQSLSVKVAVTGVPLRLRQYWNAVGTVGLRSPSGTQYLWSDFHEAHLVGVVGEQYHYEIIFRLPQWSEEGLWKLDYVELDDGNYQRSYHGPVELANLGLDIPGFIVAGVPRWWEQGYVAPPAPPLEVALVFGNLNFIYNGGEQFGSATAELAGLDDYIVITYNGLTTAPIVPGTYDVVARLVNDQYTGRQTGTMVIAAAPNAAYLQWAETHNINLLEEGSPSADPDADGFNNAQEFAFGGSPNSSDGSLVGVSSAGGELVMTWRQRQTGANYKLQWSPDLQTPFVSVDSTGASSAVAGEVEGYSETVTRMPMPPSGGGFYRIHATLTPPAP